MRRQIPLWFTAFFFNLLSIGLAYLKGSPTETLIPTPPTINSFSPMSGIIGTSVSLMETNFNVSANQISMSIGDLEGNTISDFMVANDGSATVSLFRNMSPMLSSIISRTN